MNDTADKILSGEGERERESNRKKRTIPISGKWRQAAQN